MVNKINEEKHQTQRMCLLAKARQLFASQGVKETSMSQMANACQVTKATLYHYFRSKEEILKEILACRNAEIVDMSRGPMPANLEECFYQIGKSHLEHMDKPENLELMKILLSETMKNPEMKKYYMDFVVENITRGAREVLAPFVKGRKDERELKLLFFQFMAGLIHYNWNSKMVGSLSELLGDDETFVRRLSKTYAAAVLNG
ncbi:MAG TPA: helix-turn-helix domain-containing protein [bacterium]|nr:helix-turn-helix domain-containing protein [bacterium]